jgi:prevent-host-death family protein
VSEVSATEAARRFADLLDAVEHGGERFTIVRRGRAVAHLEPISSGRGTDIKAVFRRYRPDVTWADDLASMRRLVEMEERP